MPVSLSQATWIQPTPIRSVSVRSILIFSHLCPILLLGLFSLGFPTKTLYAFLCATCLPILSCWIWWSKRLVWHTNLEAPHFCNATQCHRREGANFGNERIPKFVLLLRYGVVFQYIGTKPHNRSLLAVVNVCISVASTFPLLNVP